jgi:hypothetical protein
MGECFIIGISRQNSYFQPGERHKIPKAEMIVFLYELDDSRSKSLSPRKRSAESVRDVSEEKIPPCRARRAYPKCDVQVIIEENPMTIDDY